MQFRLNPNTGDFVVIFSKEERPIAVAFVNSLVPKDEMAREMTEELLEVLTAVDYTLMVQ